MESSPPSRFYQKTAWRKHGKRGGVFQKPRWRIPKNPGGVNFRSNLSAQASWQAARHSRAAARDHERRGSACAPALQAVTPKLGIHARVPEATLNIRVEGAGWSTARAVARRRAVAHGEACLSPVAHALGTLATAHHCSRCAPASTMNADIEGRLRDAHLNTEFWRERLQSRRARRAAPFMVARVGRRSGAAPQICDRVLEVLATRFRTA